MRVLVVHNRYRSATPSGENRVVDDEISMLRSVGVDVRTYIRSSDELFEGGTGLLRSAGNPIYSRKAVTAVRSLLSGWSPDLVHVHNLFPLISPAVLRTIRAAGVPIVQTVHNFRLGCVAGTYFRNGRICTDCHAGRVGWPGVAHGCYRQSRLQSSAMTAALAVHRSTWTLVDRFLPVSHQLRAHLEEMGLDRLRITVKPNAVRDPGVPASPGRGLLFIGRLSPEKGIQSLLEAWDRVEPSVSTDLHIIGDGPNRPLVEEAVTRCRRLRFLGPLDVEGVSAMVRQAAIVVVPSQCYEGFPRVVVEAFAHGRPVVGTNVGGLAEVIDESTGWLADPSVDGLTSSIRSAVRDPTAESKGRAARMRFVTQYSAEKVTADLIQIYEGEISGHRRRR